MFKQTILFADLKDFAGFFSITYNQSQDIDDLKYTQKCPKEMF